MRIIYYSPHPHLNLQSPSGYGVHMREMIAAFEFQGIKVLPMILGGTDKSRDLHSHTPTGDIKKFLKKGVSKKIWRTLRDIDLIYFDRKASQKLNEVVQEIKPDFIYERANYIQLSGVHVAKNRSVPHILEVNGPYIEESEFLSGTKSLIRKTIISRDRSQLLQTDLVVTVSETLKKYFVDIYDIPESKFLVLPNAFNKRMIRTDPRNQKKIREKFNLGGKTIIGFIGSIFKWHNLDNLIHSFSEFKDNDIKLLIVGFGEYVKELKKLAAKCSRSKDIIFTGKVSNSEVFDFIQIMDICTAPGAAWYQSPIKIFEYGAMGKPILAPDTEPVREVMEHGIDGYIVRPDTENIYNALEEMLGDLKAYQKMGKTFQKKVLNEYSWVKNAEKVIDSYKTTISCKKQVSDFKYRSE